MAKIPESLVWKVLEDVLRQGGAFQDGRQRFVAPTLLLRDFLSSDYCLTTFTVVLCNVEKLCSWSK
jgi:hypothetical protein